jgi:hypothetical protein
MSPPTRSRRFTASAGCGFERWFGQVDGQRKIIRGRTTRMIVDEEWLTDQS